MDSWPLPYGCLVNVNICVSLAGRSYLLTIRVGTYPSCQRRSVATLKCDSATPLGRGSAPIHTANAALAASASHSSSVKGAVLRTQAR